MRPGAAEAGPELPTDNALGGGAQGHGLLHTNNPGNNKKLYHVNINDSS